MCPRKCGSLVFTVLFLSGFALCQTTAPATRIDVSQCFNANLVTSINQTSVEHYLFFYLSIIDETTYYQVKQNASLSAVLPAGLFSGDYNNFQEARRHYFEEHSESIDYYKNLQTSIRYLPPEWQPAVQTCLNDLTRASLYGVLYYYENNPSDPVTATLELKYRSTEKSASAPRVLSSRIDGASVLDDDGKPTALLYPKCSPNKISSCPRMNIKSEFIIKRTNPNVAARVILNLDNDMSTGFAIDILPKKSQCGPSYDGAETQTDDKNLEIHNYLIEDFWGGEPNRLQLYYIRLGYAGRIADATCTAIDSYNHVMNTDANQADRWQKRGMSKNPDWGENGIFQCLGMTNTGNTRYTRVVVHWQAPKTKCEVVDWPVPPTTTAYALPDNVQPLNRIEGFDAAKPTVSIIPNVLQERQQPLLKLKPEELEQPMPPSSH
jgi:hypothetical protein